MFATSLSRRSAYALGASLVGLFLLIGYISYSGYAQEGGRIPKVPSQLFPPDDKPVSLGTQPFPTKIWQSWKDDSESPTDRTVGFPHQWRVANPSYRYERLTDGNSDAYVRDHFPLATPALFSNLTDNILRADFLRYLVMLREGGVWADIDVKPLQTIDDWIPEKFKASTNLVVGIENDHDKNHIWEGVPYSVQLSQYTILAKPNHPVFTALVQEVSQNLEALMRAKGPGVSITFEDVMSNTGPFVYTKALMDYFTEVTGGMKHTGDELYGLEEPRLIGDVLVLPKHAFGWLAHDHKLQQGDPRILVEHLFIGSWRDGHPG